MNNTTTNSTNSSDPLGSLPDGTPVPGSIVPKDFDNNIFDFVDYVVAIVSLIGCLLIFAIYIFNVRSRNFSFRLIVFLSFFFACGTILTITNDIFNSTNKNFENTQGCQTIGILREVVDCGTMFWITFIAWFMYKAAQNKLEQAQVYEKLYIAISIVVPVGLAMSYVPIGAYGSSGDYCWISKSDSAGPQDDWKIILNASVLLYGPFTLLMTTTVFFLYRALKTVKEMEIEEEAYRKIVSRFIFFPLLFSISYITNGLCFYFNVVDNANLNLTVRIIGAVFGRSQGFFLALYQYLVKRSDYLQLFSKCIKKPVKMRASMLQRSFFSKYISQSTGLGTFIDSPDDYMDEVDVDAQ